MKAEETHKSTTAENQLQPMRQPFFSKEGQGGFFSKSYGDSESFFSPATIQPKLTIGQSNDKYEVEADAMADKVVGQLQNNNSRTSPPTRVQGNNALQAKCSECGQEEKLQKKEESLVTGISRVQRRPIFESNEKLSSDGVQTKPSNVPVIQRKCAKCEEKEKIQKKEDGSTYNIAKPTPSFSTSGGQKIPENLRQNMEHKIGSNFENVRIHDDSTSINAANELGAKAFTKGNHIYFNKGHYQLDSKEGLGLLAHELTHVVQQGNGRGSSGSSHQKAAARSELEYEAENVEKNIQRSSMPLDIQAKADPKDIHLSPMDWLGGLGGSLESIADYLISTLGEQNDFVSRMNNLRRRLSQHAEIQLSHEVIAELEAQYNNIRSALPFWVPIPNISFEGTPSMQDGGVITVPVAVILILLLLFIVWYILVWIPAVQRGEPQRALRRTIDAIEDAISRVRPRPIPREDGKSCNEHMAACFLTSLADEPGHIWGSSRCVFCAEVCTRNGGVWPTSAPTTTGSVDCNYWNY